ncbi:hypothetical protein Patl1_02261 [Pistacia atlantica]|uniref:Uncharacterized protein n=1 Tax=Pistacia atlantica TaxID=434234 RepID=A0ACC1C4U8_9ROSI|nr:hypothetical protein Patl1_02261 [Pistacia atlantica]
MWALSETIGVSYCVDLMHMIGHLEITFRGEQVEKAGGHMGTEFVNNSPILESEEGYTIENLNQGQRVELDGRAEKKVHQFYFIKIWPYGDQNVNSRIEEAEKLIEKIDEDAFHINTKYRKLMSDRTYKVLCLLGRLYKRIVHIDCTVNWNTQQSGSSETTFRAADFEENCV